MAQRERIKIAVVLAAMMAIAYVHYTTNISKANVHHIYYRLNYLPIIVSAFWFGLRGGALSAAFLSVIYIPHLFVRHEAEPPVYLNKYLELMLYNVVGWVTGALSSSERRLEQQLVKAEKLAVLGEMAAGIAHEIKNPLQSIKGTAQIIENDFPREGRKYGMIAVMIEEIDRLNSLVNNFLLFARPAEPTLIEADVNHLIRKTVEAASFEIKGIERNMELALAEHLPPCPLDPERIRQVLLNLIFNAVEATDEGGSIMITSRLDGKYLVIDVIDDGRGVPEEDMESIFVPFFSRAEGGTGLGLSISQKIVESHRGRITVRNNEGAGCTFSVYLPMIREKASL